MFSEKRVLGEACPRRSVFWRSVSLEKRVLGEACPRRSVSSEKRVLVEACLKKTIVRFGKWVELNKNSISFLDAGSSV